MCPKKVISLRSGFPIFGPPPRAAPRVTEVGDFLGLLPRLHGPSKVYKRASENLRLKTDSCKIATFCDFLFPRARTRARAEPLGAAVALSGNRPAVPPVLPCPFVRTSVRSPSLGRPS